MTLETAVQYISELCKNHGIDRKEIGSINTLKSWFSGGPRPKKGETSRNAMFALAFALNLSPEDTADLFHKVYLDRAFDFRNEKELIYYYCLRNGRSWQDAQELISHLEEFSADTGDATVYTSAIKASADTFLSDEELLMYLSRQRHNFEQNNVTARETLEQLIARAKVFAKEEACRPEYDGQYRGSNRDSINFMYEVITGFPVSNHHGTTTIFKNAQLPREIKNRFPEAGMFSKKSPTYEELRKMIIMLFSYCYWYQVKKREYPPDLDNYIAEANVFLFNSGLPLLYYGNPFDWMFMYCNLSDRPLDTFRELLAEIMESPASTKDTN